MTTFTGTYSPDDNKLRLYASTRLDAETYARVRAAGYSWAPKQELFVAPMWTPGREDLLLELAGEIGDEDTSLVDRAEERADRFGEYADKRASDADAAHKGVEAILEFIPLGQPILVGHHSEKKARKDQERIENGMRKAVRMWETSTYWQSRAAGAVRAAKYKELPGVRARRIKGLEADQRKEEKTRKERETYLKLWAKIDEPATKKDGTPATPLDIALYVANHCGISWCFTLAEFPRNPPASQYEGQMSLWSALTDGIITAHQARDLAVPAHERTMARCDRWLAHIANRLAYERVMLDEQGASALLDKKPRPAQLPLINYHSETGFIATENRYHRGQIDELKQIDMTAAEYAKIHTDYKGTVTVEGTHRVRSALVKHQRVTIFITDSKIHTKPTVPAKEPKPAPAERQHKLIADTKAKAQPEEPKPEPKAELNDAAFKAMKATLREGITVAVVPQLFPTPANVAADMVAAAEIEPGHRVLEPSAGTGALLRAVADAGASDVFPIEIDRRLADSIPREVAPRGVHCADFLAYDPPHADPESMFDRIVMNPPFANGADIKHIEHARRFLRPGGRLVALCADGPRQRAALQPLAAEWTSLPPGSFKEQGTNVNVAMLVINA